MIKLHVLSVQEAKELLSDSDIQIDHAISIGEPGYPAPWGLHRVPKVLRQEYHDVVHPKYLERAVRAGQTPPSKEHVVTLLRFAEDLNLWRGSLLVHCFAGISRSTASALIVLNHLLGPGQEAAAVKFLMQARPEAKPNMCLVTFADHLTGSRLRDALNDAGVRAW